MTKLYMNLEELMPETVKSMPLMQHARIQGEVVKLLSHIVEAILNRVSINILTRMLTKITLKYKITPKRNNEEIIEIFKRGKIKTLIRFKHDRSGSYGMNTCTVITNYK